MDTDMLLQLAKEHMSILTLEEGVKLGGFGSAVLEFYAEEKIYGLEVRNLGIPDEFVEHGSIKEQLGDAGITIENVIAEIKSLIPRKRQRA